MLKVSRSWCHFSLTYAPLWTAWASQKHVCTIWCYLDTLAEAIQVLKMEFSPNQTKDFRFIRSSMIIAEQPEKRAGVNKSLWKKMQRLQKAKITVMYSQDIMLDDNIIRLSLSFNHCSHNTISPVTFQIDHIYIYIYIYNQCWWLIILSFFLLFKSIYK